MIGKALMLRWARKAQTTPGFGLRVIMLKGMVTYGVKEPSWQRLARGLFGIL